jgi:polysaccharide biosynthesis protein PslG
MRLAAIVFASVATSAVLAGGAAPVTSFKPVSFAILEDYDKGESFADVEKDFALFNELDISTWRGSFGWDDYEPSRGKYEFEWLHRFAERAAARGIELRPYLGYTPEWAARASGTDKDAWNNPPADLQRWERFAGAMARALRQHPNVRSYEIYNEENVRQWWDGTAQEYARVLVRGARAIRRQDRDAHVVFGGLVFPDKEWIEDVCATSTVRGSFDVLPFHAYPETWTPPEVTAENYLGGLDAFAATADEVCGRRPIWINETGFATVPGKSERDQASWWVRAVATFLAHPRVEHIGVYEIKDLPSDKPVIGDAPNYHLGLTRADRTRKLAFYTVDLLTDLLDTGTLRVADGEVTVATAETETRTGLFHHMFARPDGARVIIVWRREGAKGLTLTLQSGARSATEYQLDGRESEVTLSEGRTIRGVDLEPGRPRIFKIVG